MIFKPAQPISGKDRFFICWLNPNSFSLPYHHLSCGKLTLFIQAWERPPLPVPLWLSSGPRAERKGIEVFPSTIISKLNLSVVSSQIVPLFSLSCGCYGHFLKDWKIKPHNISITITEEKLYACEQQRQHSKRNGLIKDQHVAMKRKSESRYICIWPGYIYMNNRYMGSKSQTLKKPLHFT